MSQETQIARIITCPHCGREHTLIIPVEPGAAAAAPAGLAQAARKIQALLKDRSVDDAAAWVALPPCPACHTPYEYNPRSGETR